MIHGPKKNFQNKFAGYEWVKMIDGTRMSNRTGTIHHLVGSSIPRTCMALHMRVHEYTRQACVSCILTGSCVVAYSWLLSFFHTEMWNLRYKGWIRKNIFSFLVLRSYSLFKNMHEQIDFWTQWGGGGVGDPGLSDQIRGRGVQIPDWKIGSLLRGGEVQILDYRIGYLGGEGADLEAVGSDPWWRLLHRGITFKIEYLKEPHLLT
jgi:hypothetical protein